MAVLPPGTTLPSTLSNNATTLSPSGPPIKPDVPFTINTPTGYVSVGTGGGALVTNPTGKGDTPAEQFTLSPATSTTAGVITPGGYTYMKSVLTGKYCRLVPGATPGSQVVVCDLDTTAQAAPLKYTGSGVTYNGQPLLPGGPGQPLTIGGNTTVNPTGDGTGTELQGPALQIGSATPPPAKRRGCPSPPPKGRTTACKPPPRAGSTTGKKQPPPRRSPAAKPGQRLTKPPPPNSKTKGRRPPPATSKERGQKPPPLTSAVIKPLVPKPPPASSSALLNSPPRRWPSPVTGRGTSTSSRRTPPEAGAAAAAGAAMLPVPRPKPVQVPVSTSAPPASNEAAGPFSSAQQQGAAEGCEVQLGASCGGISLCGVDGPCEGQCCSAGGTCARRSAFSWTCQ